jgi:hypothetical protein
MKTLSLAPPRRTSSDGRGATFAVVEGVLKCDRLAQWLEINQCYLPSRVEFTQEWILTACLVSVDESGGRRVIPLGRQPRSPVVITLDAFSVDTSPIAV